MTYNQLDLYKNSLVYCMLKVEYDKTKWYQFLIKRAIKEKMDFYYPLMVNEVKMIHNLK